MIAAGSRAWARPSVSLVLAVAVALTGPPLVAIVATSFQRGALTPRQAWTLENYGAVWRSVSAGGAVVNTLVFSVGCAVVALAVGGLLAFIVERTDTPFRRLGYVAAILVAAIPAPVYAIAWMLLFSRRGLVNAGLQTVSDLLGADPLVISISNLGGMILVEGLNYSALAFLLLIGPMRSMDRALEEAAFTSGARAWQVLRHVTAPLLAPSVYATLLLTFLRAIESFAIPAIIGLPGRVSVITTEIYLATVQQMPPQYGLSSAFGVVLIALVVVLLWFYTNATAHAAKFATITGKGFRPRLIEMGRARGVTFGVLALYFVVLVFLPIFVLVWASLQEFYSGATLDALSFATYATLWANPQIVQAFLDSIIVGVIAATVIVTLATAAARASVRSGSRTLARIIDLSLSVPLALPGMVLGLALLQIYARLPLPIYGTLTALVIASVIRFVPFGYRYSHAGLLQLHSELEEAALVSGARGWQVLAHIVLPLIALPLVSSFVYVFLLAVRELESSVLLASGKTQVVAPMLLSMFENGFIPEVAAFSTVVVFVFGTLGYVAYELGRRFGLGAEGDLGSGTPT